MLIRRAIAFSQSVDPVISAAFFYFFNVRVKYGPNTLFLLGVTFYYILATRTQHHCCVSVYGECRYCFGKSITEQMKGGSQCG